MPIPTIETESNRPDLARYIENDPDNQYEYLQRPDLTDEDIVSTKQAYDNAASLYSVLEWSEPSIDSVWKDVFKGELRDIIKSLPRNSVVYVPGCGTGKDAYTLSLLNSHIKIIASDLSASMLREGKRRFNWAQIVNLAKQIHQSGGNTNGSGWISRIMNYYMLEIDEALPEFEAKMEEVVLSNITSRFSFVQGKLEEQIFAPESLDVIISLANLQHLPDELLLSTLVEYINLLKPGGVFHFNLRLDLDPMTFVDPTTQKEVNIGKVFRDNALKFWRYYNTLSVQEVEYLVRYLKKAFGNQIDIIITDPSYHPNRLKPAFQNIRIVKKQ